MFSKQGSRRVPGVRRRCYSLGIGGARMKLFLSALLLAAMPAAFAQNQPVPSSPDLGVAGMAASNGQVYPFLQRVCPLDFTAASVTSPAGYLPVSQRRPDDGTLTLHFR